MLITSIIFATSYGSSFFVYAVDNSKTPTYRCIESQDPADESGRHACCRTQEEMRDGKKVTVLYCVICEKNGQCDPNEIEVGILGKMVNPSLDDNMNPNLNENGGSFAQQTIDETDSGEDMHTSKKDLMSINPSFGIQAKNNDNDPNDSKQELMIDHPNLDVDNRESTLTSEHNPVNASNNNIFLQDQVNLGDNGLGQQSQNNDPDTSDPILADNNNVHLQDQYNDGNNGLVQQSQENEPECDEIILCNNNVGLGVQLNDGNNGLVQQSQKDEPETSDSLVSNNTTKSEK